jgi:hypothetical protein
VALGTDFGGKTAFCIALGHALPAATHKNILLASLVEADVSVVGSGPSAWSFNSIPTTIARSSDGGNGNGDKCDDNRGRRDR